MRNIIKKKKCLLFKHEKNNQTLSNDWPTYCHTGKRKLWNVFFAPKCKHYILMWWKWMHCDMLGLPLVCQLVTICLFIDAVWTYILPLLQTRQLFLSHDTEGSRTIAPQTIVPHKFFSVLYLVSDYPFLTLWTPLDYYTFTSKYAPI